MEFLIHMVLVVLVSTFSHRFKFICFGWDLALNNWMINLLTWVYVAPPKVTLNNFPEKSFGVSWEEEYSICFNQKPHGIDSGMMQIGAP